MASLRSKDPFVLCVDTSLALSGTTDRLMNLATSFDEQFTKYRMTFLGGAIRTQTDPANTVIGLRVKGFNQYSSDAADPNTLVAFTHASDGFIFRPGFECVVFNPSYSQITVVLEDVSNPLVGIDKDSVFLLQFTPIVD